MEIFFSDEYSSLAVTPCGWGTDPARRCFHANIFLRLPCCASFSCCEAVNQMLDDIELSGESCPHSFNEPKAFVESEIH